MININIRTLMPVREEPSLACVVRHSSLTGMLTYSSSIHASPLPQTTCDKILEQILGTLKRGGLILDISLTIICSRGKKKSTFTDSCSSQFNIEAMRVQNLVYLEASFEFPYLQERTIKYFIRPSVFISFTIFKIASKLAQGIPNTFSSILP